MYAINKLCRLSALFALSIDIFVKIFVLDVSVNSECASERLLESIDKKPNIITKWLVCLFTEAATEGVL